MGRHLHLQLVRYWSPHYHQFLSPFQHFLLYPQLQDHHWTDQLEDSLHVTYPVSHHFHQYHQDFVVNSHHLQILFQFLHLFQVQVQFLDCLYQVQRFHLLLCHLQFRYFHYLCLLERLSPCLLYPNNVNYLFLIKICLV